MKALLSYIEHRLEYHGPKSAKLGFVAMTPERLKAGMKYALPKVNGKTLDLNPEYSYHSPYLQKMEGSDIVESWSIAGVQKDNAECEEARHSL